jgi:predicted branched-subunit amino acid permease
MGSSDRARADGLRDTAPLDTGPLDTGPLDTAPLDDVRPAWRLGVRDAIGMPGLVLCASMVGFGSLARESGLSVAMAVAATAGMWALPGQIVFAEMHSAAGQVVAMLGAVSLANARFFPMAASLMPLLRSGLRGTGWMFLLAHLMSAQSWAYCRRVFPGLTVKGRRPYFLGFALTIMTYSVLGTVLGHVMTAALPRPVTLGLLLLNPLFLLLLFADSRGRAVVYALAGGAVLGPLLHPVAPDWGLLAAGLVAGTGGFLVARLLHGPSVR